MIAAERIMCGAFQRRSIPMSLDIANSTFNGAARTEKNESGGFLARRLGDPVDLSRRLLEAGDIEPNPGPKWPCGFCNKEVKNTGWSIKCVDCLQYIHRECLGWSVREIKSYDGYRWHCGCDHLKSNTADPNPIRPRTKEGLKIIQLNVDGWRGKGDVVKKLAYDTQADILVLQETKLTEKAKVPNSGDWVVFRKDRTVHQTETTNERAQGGVAIAVRPGLECKEISLSMPLTAVLETVSIAVKTGNSWLEIHNVYRPPAKSGQYDQRDSKPYLDKWPCGSNSIIFADMNAHGSWDRNKVEDKIGEEVDEWLINKDMCLLNSGGATRVAKNGSGTAPDITVVHSSRANHCNWTTIDSVGSDHLPILISSCNKVSKVRTRPNLNMKKADWPEFERLLEQSLSLPEDFKSLEALEKLFAKAIMNAAKGSIPVTTRKDCKPWWTKECAVAKKSMNNIQRQLRKSPGDDLLISAAEEASKVFKKTIEVSKREAWRKYAAELSPRDPTTKVWNTLRAMDGRKKERLPNTPVDYGGKSITADREKAKVACKTYASVSRVTVKREDSKQAYLTLREAIKLNWDSEINESFSIAELGEALRSLKPKSAGSDGVHPLMLKHLANAQWGEGKGISTLFG